MEYNLKVKNLSKKYNDFSLNNIDIFLPKGKIVGLIGENGSGKTTTIKAILNIISTDSGKIEIFGNVHSNLSKDLKETIGVVLDDSFLAPQLMLDDINSIMKKIYTNWDEELYNEYIEKFKLPKNKIIKEFSSGMKMKIKIIIALSHHPKLLILDEPTNGLDPVARYEMLEIFEDFVSNNENSILVSSHITSDLEHIADEIIFIDNGKCILSLDKDDFLNNYGIVFIHENEFKNIESTDYINYLKYKNEYMFMIDNKYKFMKKYRKYQVNRPSIEELMLILIKGVK